MNRVIAHTVVAIAFIGGYVAAWSELVDGHYAVAAATAVASTAVLWIWTHVMEASRV